MKKLLQKAHEMRQNAHAPHSNFKVGASILTIDNTIVGGCNIESDSYGLTICAERNAIFSAYAQGYRTFKALLIVIERNLTPCGACRQIIAELCGNIPVIVANPHNQIVKFQSYDLIPHHFSLPLSDLHVEIKNHETTI